MDALNHPLFIAIANDNVARGSQWEVSNEFVSIPSCRRRAANLGNGEWAPPLHHLISSPRCEKEEDLAMIAAQQYFIEFGTDMNAERLMNLLPNYIPDYCLTGEKPVDHWHTLILQAFKKSYYVKERVPDLKAKEDVVSYAKYKWPLLFSRFYEAFRYSGAAMIN
jgi:hypothetical protein